MPGDLVILSESSPVYADPNLNSRHRPLGWGGTVPMAARTGLAIASGPPHPALAHTVTGALVLFPGLSLLGWVSDHHLVWMPGAKQ